MKCLHSADWHLRDKDIEECEKCLQVLTHTARKENIDLAVLAGDLLDSQDTKLDSPSARLLFRVISELANICPIAIVLGTASHDGKAAEILQFVKGKYPVHVAARPQQIALWKNIFTEVFDGVSKLERNPDAIITLIPTPTKQFLQGTDQDISQAMSAVFAGFGAQASQFDCPHILVGHFNVKGSKLPSGEVRIGMDIETSVDQMNLGNFSLGCLGHIHIQQCLGEKYFFSGPIYATKIDEIGPKGFWIHQYYEGQSPAFESTFIETPCKKKVRFQNNFTEEMSIDELPSILNGACQLNDVEGAYVRYDITVWQDEAGQVDKEQIKEDFKLTGALDVDVRIIRLPRQTVRSEAVLKAETLRDKIQKMAEIKNEEVSWSILTKAEILEGKPAEELIKAVTA